MSNIVKVSGASRVQSLIARRNNGTLSRGTLPQSPTTQQAEPRAALLLDLSGSMAGKSEKPGERRIDALRNVVSDIQIAPDQPVYLFSYSVARCDPKHIPEPSGGTDLAKAFKYLKAEGHKSVVLITDGQPDDPEEALEAAKGLRLEIFYVGDGRKPAFLNQLAKACGGSASQVSMNKTTRGYCTRIVGIVATKQLYNTCNCYTIKTVSHSAHLATAGNSLRRSSNGSSNNHTPRD